MKFSLAICVAVCFAGVYCDTAPTPKEMQYVKDCASKNNMDDKMVEDLKKSKSLTMNQDTMCFTHCVMKHNGMMDDEGKMTAKFEAVEHADDCKMMTGKDKCETAAKIMDCMMNKEHVSMKDLNL